MANSKRGLNDTQQHILMIVHGYLTHWNITHSLISQAWIIGRLAEWYDVKISRSTLSYNLRWLKANGYLDIKTRHCKNKVTGEMEFHVSLYKMTLRLKTHFLGWATYFRNIGWKNYISKGKRRLVSVAQQVEAATVGMSAAEFFADMRKRGIA